MSCPDCFRGAAAPGTPTGTTSPLHGHSTYTAFPASPRSPSTIILYTDAFGHLLPNNLLLADALADATGLTVLCPDIIPGGGMSPAVLPLLDTFTSPSANYLSKGLTFARAMLYVLPFFARAAPQKPRSTAPCIAYARAVRQSLPSGGKLGCVGYCWGGFQGLAMAGLEVRVLDALFVAHPARFEPKQVVSAVEKGVRVSFAHAGQDRSLKGEKVDEVRRVEGVEVRVYEGCGHGFAVRAQPGMEREGEAKEEALGQAVEWCRKWL